MPCHAECSIICAGLACVAAGAAAGRSRRPAPIDALGRQGDQDELGRRPRPTGSRGSTRTRRRRCCSQYRNVPPKAVADAIVAREKAAIVYPADGKLMGDWKKGEKLAQSGYGWRFTDYPPRAAERRQLLCLPPARRQGAELRHAGAEPAGVRQDPQDSPRPTSRPSTSGSTTRMPRSRARTCPAWGQQVPYVDQIKDLVAYVMSPESPVNK